MRPRIATGILSLMLFAGAPLFVGCDKTLSKDETVHTNPDGSQTKDSTTVSKTPDGSVVKTQDSSKTP